MGAKSGVSPGGLTKLIGSRATKNLLACDFWLVTLHTYGVGSTPQLPARFITIRLLDTYRGKRDIMRTYTTERLKQEVEGVPLITASAVIKRLPEAITKPLQTQVHGLVDTEAAIIANDLTTQYRQEYETAVAQESEIAQKIEEHEALCEDAQVELQAARATPGSCIRSVIYWICAVCAALCEYYVTNVTLPMALDVDRNSLLGIALSLGPVVAFIFVEKPLEYLQKSAWRKTYQTFLWVVLGANLATVVLIAQARHEVARVVQQLLRGESHIAFDDLALNRAILALSLVLVIDGAIFLLDALKYGRLWVQYRKVIAKVSRLEARRSALRADKTRHAAVVAASKERMSGKRPELIAQHFKQQCLVAMEHVKVVEPTSVQKVEEALGLTLGMSMASAAMN